MLTLITRVLIHSYRQRACSQVVAHTLLWNGSACSGIMMLWQCFQAAGEWLCSNFFVQRWALLGQWSWSPNWIAENVKNNFWAAGVGSNDLVFESRWSQLCQLFEGTLANKPQLPVEFKIEQIKRICDKIAVKIRTQESGVFFWTLWWRIEWQWHQKT